MLSLWCRVFHAFQGTTLEMIEKEIIAAMQRRLVSADANLRGLLDLVRSSAMVSDLIWLANLETPHMRASFALTDSLRHDYIAKALQTR